MFQVDVDGDGMGKFDWVLLSANGNAAYKLDGVAADGGFAYAGPIDIDYKINGNSITTGAKGTLDAPTPPAEDCSNGCSNINSNNLEGYTVITEWKSGPQVKDVLKTTYVFLQNTQAIVVLEYANGSQRVARGTYYPYEEGNGLAFTNSSAKFDNGEDYIDGLDGPNDLTAITVGKSHNIFNNIVTSIIPNDANDIDEATVSSSIVEDPESDEGAPNYAVLSSASSLMLYNNLSTAQRNTIFNQVGATNNMSRYDSSVALHCSDYGYTMKMVSSTTDGVMSTSYMSSDMQKMCLEFEYHSGNLSMAIY
jgi:hypothetical protein